jgi:LEA14-like dessication related protein
MYFLFHKISLQLILSILILSLFTSCSFYKEIEMNKVEKVIIKSLNEDGMIIRVSIQIKNPNPYKITILGSDLKISIRNKILGTAHIEQFTIAASKEEVYHMNVEARFTSHIAGNMKELMGFFAMGISEVKLKGEVKAKAFFIERYKDFEITEKVQF